MGKKGDGIMPSFETGSLELRYENDVVCVYGNREGLRRLISLCQELLDKGPKNHVHLEDYNLLSAESKRGTVALF